MVWLRVRFLVGGNLRLLGLRGAESSYDQTRKRVQHVQTIDRQEQ